MIFEEYIEAESGVMSDPNHFEIDGCSLAR